MFGNDDDDDCIDGDQRSRCSVSAKQFSLFPTLPSNMMSEDGRGSNDASRQSNGMNLSNCEPFSPATAEKLHHTVHPPEACTVEAELIEYRGRQIAAFQSDDDLLLCLPQAYELFLKRLVSGLHTVYTKLKRLDIMPTVCNVEQVRALRSIGAIQPGVNRCKLISCADFDLLYEDCASSCSRPGRPRKRGNCTGVYTSQANRMELSDTYTTGLMFGPNKRLRHSEDFLSTSNIYDRDGKIQKEANVASDEHDSPGVSTATNSGTSDYLMSAFGGPLNGNGFGQQMLPFFPIAAQQLIFNHLMATAGQKSMTIPPWPTVAAAACQGSNNMEAASMDIQSALNPGQSLPAASNEEFSHAKILNPVSGVSQDTLKRPMTATDALSSVANAFSLEQILISMSGMVEFALTVARRQDEQLQKEKEDIMALLEEERRKRIQLEVTLKEKEKVQKACAVHIKSLKTVISQLKSTCSNGISDNLQIPEEPWDDYLTISEDKGHQETNEQDVLKEKLQAT